MTKNACSNEVYLRLLELDKGATLQELIEKIACYRGNDIVVKSALLPAIITGCTIRTDDRTYAIFYEQGKTGRQRDIVILHELAHILRGDLDLIPTVNETDFLSQIYSRKIGDIGWKDNAVLRSSLGCDPEKEKQTEQLACELLEKLIPSRLHLLEETNRLWLD